MLDCHAQHLGIAVVQLQIDAGGPVHGDRGVQDRPVHGRPVGHGEEILIEEGDRAGATFLSMAPIRVRRLARTSASMSSCCWARMRALCRPA